MRNTRWLRRGFVAAVFAYGTFAALVAACGDDDSATSNQPDASPDTSVGEAGDGESGGPDASPDSRAIKPANIYVVNGATDFGPGNPNGMVRVCYATKSATAADFGISPLPPLPSTIPDGSALTIPGIPIGAGGPFPSTGVPLEALGIRPYVISAAALADRGVVGETGLATIARCPFLLGPGAGIPSDGGFANDAGPLEKDTDYWQLADIPAGTFENGKTYILGIYGCTQDTDPTAITGYGGKCGPNLNGTGAFAPDGGKGPGNLKVVVLELDTATTVGATQIGVQVAHLSPQYEVYKNQPAVSPFAPVMANGDSTGPDASTKQYVSADGGENEITFQAAPTAPTPMVKITGIASNQGYFAANDTTFNAPLAMFVALPMNNTVGKQPSVQVLTEGKANAAELYVNGKTYTFVLIGDPAPPGDPQTLPGSLRRVHFLGFPNAFPTQ